MKGKPRNYRKDIDRQSVNDMGEDFSSDFEDNDRKRKREREVLSVYVLQEAFMIQGLIPKTETNWDLYCFCSPCFP